PNLDYSIAIAFLDTFGLSKDIYGISLEPANKMAFSINSKNPEENLFECRQGWNAMLVGRAWRLANISIRFCDSNKVIGEIDKLKDNLNSTKGEVGEQLIAAYG